MTDAELALLGHLIGDGCVLPRHSVQYTTQDVDLANEVASQAKEIFGDKVRPHIQKVIQKSRKPLYQLFLSASEKLTYGRRNPVGSWFTKLGIFGRRAWEKRVPETMALLADSDIYWDEVASVVPDGKEEVFDLTVPGHHNFVADDIIVHNSIEQDADVVMFIYRPEIYGLKAPDGGSLEGIAEIIIGKQRNGPTGSVHMMWNAESATYEQMAPEWRMDQEDEDF